MKAVKFLLKLILWIVVIVLAIVLTLPLWIGPVAKTAANAIVPKKTLTAFNLGAFALNPYTGKLSVGDVQLANPQGFSPEMAATLGSLDVSVDMTSVAGDLIVIKDITLKDVFVSYVMNVKGENNFSVIAKNAKGGEEKPEDKKVKAKGEGEQRNAPSQTSQTSQTSQPSSSKKVIIDHLLISGVTLQLGPIPIPQPISIELTGIGRKSNGVTMEEAWNQISEQVMQNLNALGVNVNDLLKNLGDVNVEKAMKHIDKATKVLDAIQKGGVKGLSDSVNSIGGGAKKSLGTAGGATTKSVEAVNETTKKTMDSVGKGAKDAADSVNKQIDKAAEAVNAIKGLF